MAELLVNPEFLDNPETAGLLPVEKEVDGKLQKIEYMFEISAANQISFKNGGAGLKCQFATTYQGNRLYSDELFFYTPPASSRLAKLVAILQIPTKGIKEEDFIGMFFWATVRHEQYDSTKEFNSDSTPVKVTKNMINQFIRRATAEEVTGASGVEEEITPF
jgi:hypothetical protein